VKSKVLHFHSCAKCSVHAGRYELEIMALILCRYSHSCSSVNVCGKRVIKILLVNIIARGCRDNLVVLTSLWTACVRRHGSFPGKNKRFFFSRHRDWF